jgi:transcriptional regulator GlxA family with amidase domain
VDPGAVEHRNRAVRGRDRYRQIGAPKNDGLGPEVMELPDIEQQSVDGLRRDHRLLQVAQDGTHDPVLFLFVRDQAPDAPGLERSPVESTGHHERRRQHPDGAKATAHGLTQDHVDQVHHRHRRPGRYPVVHQVHGITGEHHPVAAGVSQAGNRLGQTVGQPVQVPPAEQAFNFIPIEAVDDHLGGFPPASAGPGSIDQQLVVEDGRRRPDPPNHTDAPISHGNSFLDTNAPIDIIIAMRIDILTLDGVFDLGLSALLDTFQTANELIEAAALPVSPFQVRIVAVRKRVSTSQGFSVPVHPAGGRTPDCVIVPALGFKMPDPLVAALARPDIGDAAQVLQQWARQGATMAAACIGTFVMAESGLLDRQRATTTWWLAPLFRQRYPSVVLEESSMIVKSGRVVTAGAALGHLDLALWMVRRVSPQLASLTARYLIVDPRPSQSAYALTDHLMHNDPMIHRFEAWARGRLRQGFSLDQAAKAVGASKRTLARRMQSVLGKSPLGYFQSLRVELAVHLLKTGSASVEQVAARVGYADGATLRTLLRRQLNRGVKEIRRNP